MPQYKNIAPRIIGVALNPEAITHSDGRVEVVTEAHLVLVNPQATIDCLEDEAAAQLRKGALELVVMDPPPEPEPPPERAPTRPKPPEPLTKPPETTKPEPPASKFFGKHHRDKDE